MFQSRLLLKRYCNSFPFRNYHIDPAAFRNSRICFFFNDQFVLLSSRKTLDTIPARTAPVTGARIKSHNCCKAQWPSANKAWLILLAGFTEVLVTGILIRCISVRASPMANPAKPWGALRSVAPIITIRNIRS